MNPLATYKEHVGSSLVVLRLRLGTPQTRGPDSIPGRGTGSHMLQLKIPSATVKASAAK